MTDLAEEKTQKLLRRIVREETSDLRDDLRKIVHEETAGMRQDITTIKDDLSNVKNDLSNVKDDVTNIKGDLSNVKDDLKTVNAVQGQQGILLRTVQSDLGSLKNSFRTQAQEMKRLGVLFEDLDHRFQTGNELYGA